MTDAIESCTNTSFVVDLDGKPTTCGVLVRNRCVVDLTFTYRKIIYTLQGTTDNRRFNALFRAYLKAYPIDSPFGSITGDGMDMHISAEQKEQFCVIVARHTMQCLDAIIRHQGRSMLDYAVWFYDVPHEGTYSDLIQDTVCYFIRRNHFISASAQFQTTTWKAD